MILKNAETNGDRKELNSSWNTFLVRKITLAVSGVSNKTITQIALMERGIISAMKLSRRWNKTVCRSSKFLFSNQLHSRSVSFSPFWLHLGNEALAKIQTSVLSDMTQQEARAVFSNYFLTRTPRKFFWLDRLSSIAHLGTYQSGGWTQTRGNDRYELGSLAHS